MGEQVWNFAGIDGGVGEMHGAVATTHGLLDEGKGSLMSLSSVWGGDGSAAYLAVQNRWDNTANELNSALQNLAQTISEASSTMMQTESGVQSLFT